MVNKINTCGGSRPTKPVRSSPGEARVRTRMTSRLRALPLVLCLVAGACGGSEESVASSDAGSEEGMTQDSGASEGNSEESGSTSGDETGEEAGATGSNVSILWTAPEGMDPTTIAVSPDGAQVAVGFEAPVSIEAAPVMIVVFDVASGAEAWRSQLEDGGNLGLGSLMFTSAGVSFFAGSFDGSQIVTFGQGGEVTLVIGIDSICAQFLNGGVSPNENVAYTVVPGGFCRVDLTTADVVQLDVHDLDSGADLVDSIRFDAAGNLVATYTDGNFAVTSVTLEPRTLISNGPANAEPISVGDSYKDQLAEGLGISSGNRVAASADGSTIALLQPGSIEILG